MPKIKKTLGKKARSAISGKYISKGAAKRNPKTSVLESTKPKRRKAKKK